jgi:hypothetical protein
MMGNMQWFHWISVISSQVQFLDAVAAMRGVASCRVGVSDGKTAPRAAVSWIPRPGPPVVVEAAGMPEIMGFSHVDLTVSNCDRAVQWWQDVLGFMLVHQVHEATYHSRAMIHPSGIAVTVMTRDATAESGTFDERRIGNDRRWSSAIPTTCSSNSTLIQLAVTCRI